METTINERLDMFLEKNKMSKAEMARKLTGKKRAAVTNWANGNQDIPEDVILSILTIFKTLNANWFLHGFGKMMNTPEEIVSMYYELEDPASPYIPLFKTERDKYEERIISLEKSVATLASLLAEAKKGGCSPGEIEGGVEKSSKAV